jgi:hypothetical protein
MVIGYYWSLNDPRADGLGYARNSNDPGARMYQGQIKNTTLPSSSEASPTVVEVNVQETRVYDPRFYVMYISVYRGDTQIGFYREQKSAFDWDYSATPPVRKKIVPVTAAPISETTRISREQAIETASNTLPDSIVKRADISAEIHGWYWEVIFDKLNAEAAELMPWPLKGPPPLPPGQPTLEPYAGIWQSIIITLDAQTGELKSGGARQAPQHGPYLKREEAVKNATETITPDAAIWGVETDWFENAHMEAYLRGDTWIVLFWEEGSKENRFSVTVNAVTGFVSGAGRG